VQFIPVKFRKILAIGPP